MLRLKQSQMQRKKMDLKNLSEQWLEAKTLERDAAERRRVLEDQMRRCLKIEDAEEGTVSSVVGNYKIKASCRINRKIDPEQFLMLANESKIEVQDFTRWKCELVMSAWKKQPEFVQQVLSRAITTEPGRATFSVEVIETTE
jgi:hypothetical protein